MLVMHILLTYDIELIIFPRFHKILDAISIYVNARDEFFFIFYSHRNDDERNIWKTT
jgi:hypothetical protein